MTTKEFLEKHNYAPYEFYEVAELASTITDDEKTANAAKAFLDSKENLEMQLDSLGFESG